VIVASVVSVSTNVVVAGITALVTAAGTQFVTRLQASADRRRERYASAVQTLVAWVEFPYRVRRRVDDDPATLAALADLGHDLQERLAGDRAWIESENREVAARYAEVAARVRALVGPAVSEAWQSPPASTPDAMVLGQWGPGMQADGWLEELQRAISWRFRWSHRWVGLPAIRSDRTTP